MCEELHPNYQDVLTENYHLFSRYLYAKDFIDELIGKSVLSPNDKDLITNPFINQTRRQQATALVDVLMTKGPKGYDCFLEILEFQYPHVFKEVTGTEPRPLPKGARRNRHSDRLLLLENLPNLAHHIREQFKQNEKLAMQLSVLEGLMTDSQVEKAELEKELEFLKKEKSDKSREITTLKTQSEKLQADVNKLNEDIRTEMERSHQIRDERDDLKQKVQELQIELDQGKSTSPRKPELGSQRNVQDLRDRHILEQNKILREQLEEQIKHTEEYADRLMQSESKETELGKWIKSLKHELKQAVKEHEILNREKMELKKKNETYMEKIKQKHDEIDMLQSQKHEAENMRREIWREKEKLFEDFHKLEDQLQQANSELDRLKSRLSRSSQEMSSSNEEGQEDGLERRTNIKFDYDGSKYADRIERGQQEGGEDSDSDRERSLEQEESTDKLKSSTLPTGSGKFDSPEFIFQQEVAHLRWTLKDRKPRLREIDNVSMDVNPNSFKKPHTGLQPKPEGIVPKGFEQELNSFIFSDIPRKVSGQPVVHSEDPDDTVEQASTTSSETLLPRASKDQTMEKDKNRPVMRAFSEPASPIEAPTKIAIKVSTSLSDFPSHEVYSVLLPRSCGVIRPSGIPSSASLVTVTVKQPILNDKFEIIGGNHTGIFVSKVKSLRENMSANSIAVGDQIKEIIYTPNERADPVITSLQGCTLDEVHRLLSEEFIRRRKEREVQLRLRKSHQEYDQAKKWITENQSSGQNGTGDFFYIRCNYEKRDTAQQQSNEETMLKPNDIFLVRDTRCDQRLWAGYKINELTGVKDSQLTRIFNKNWAKRKLATLVRGHSNEEEVEKRHPAFKVKGQVYERVLPMKASVKLPVILFGPDALVEATMDLVGNNLGDNFTIKKPGEDAAYFELYRLDSHSVWKGKLDKIVLSQKHIQKIIFLIKITSQDALDTLSCIFGPNFTMTIDEQTIEQGTYLKEKLGEKGFQIEELCFPELNSKDTLLSKFRSCVQSSQDRTLWLSQSEMDSSVADKYLTYLGPDLSTIMTNLQNAQSFDPVSGSDQ